MWTGKYFCACFVLCLGACSSSKNVKTSHCEALGNFYWCMQECRVHEDENKHNPKIENDVLKGTLKCAGLQLAFESGKLPNPIPLDDRSYFAQCFRNYYYTRFFDMIHIDKKVQRLFRDSVTITHIKYIRAGEDPDCNTCNVILDLTFRGNKIPFPVFVTQELIQDFQAIIEEENTEDLSITYYYNAAAAGAYIRKKEDINRENALSIRWHGGTMDALKKLVKTHLRTTTPN